MRGIRTALYCICLSIISDVRCLRFGYLHQTILLYFSQCYVFLVPRQRTNAGYRILRPCSSTTQKETILTEIGWLRLAHFLIYPLVWDLKLNDEADAGDGVDRWWSRSTWLQKILENFKWRYQEERRQCSVASTGQGSTIAGASLSGSHMWCYVMIPHDQEFYASEGLQMVHVQKFVVAFCPIFLQQYSKIHHCAD